MSDFGVQDRKKHFGSDHACGYRKQSGGLRFSWQN